MHQELIERLLSLTPEIRYVAIARGQDVELRERPGLEAPSESDSDRFEELLVNPTLLKLARQRGEIDCGGLRFLIVGYGNFHQLVLPFRDGHVSVAFELESNPLTWAPRLESVLAAHEASTGDWGR